MLMYGQSYVITIGEASAILIPYMDVVDVLDKSCPQVCVCACVMIVR